MYNFSNDERSESQMYKRLSAVLFPIALIALIGAGVYGYQENRDKNAVLIKAENQYQRAFHDLSYQMDKLNNELGNTVAVNSSSQDFYRKNLVNVWRITSDARNNITQLPLTLMPFNKTQDFLDNVSKFAYRTSVRDLSKNPMTPQERKTLQTLYERSKEINSELSTVQNKVMAQNLRWMDVETAVASQKNPQDNVIVDGMKSMDKKVSQFSEINWGTSMSSVSQNKKMTAFSGPDVTADDVKRKAAQFLGLRDAANLRVTENGKGTEYHTYTVSGQAAGGHEEVNLDYSKKGGHLIFYMNPKVVNAKRLDVRSARDAAVHFLDVQKYPRMAPVSYDEFRNIANITFARTQGDTIIYPEKVTVSVSLADGQILGLQAADYVVEHKERKLDTPKISLEQAKKEFDGSFQHLGHDMAVIKNDLDEEVHCYQFMGRINGNLYKVFVNADTGIEEKIENLRTAEKTAISK
jgi:spore germination protein